MKINFKNILKSIALLSLLAFSSLSYASSVVVSQSNVSVSKGDKFQIGVSIDPSNTYNYTAKIRIDFPENLLKVSSFNMDRNWLVLPLREYDEINNTKGYLVKTGGFPQGFNSKTLFGTVTFEAKEAGSGSIVVGKDSLVLDAANNNVLEGIKTVKVAIGSAEPAVIAIPEEAKFITKTEIVNPTVARSSNLEVKVIFEDFGSSQVPVDIRYLVFDEEDRLVFDVTDGVIVYGTAEYIKKLDDSNLPQGNYVLRVKTLVDQKIQGEQTAYFKVISSEEVSTGVEAVFYPMLVLGSLIILVILIVWRRRKKSEQGNY
jgi:hypothetical protein